MSETPDWVGTSVYSGKTLGTITRTSSLPGSNGITVTPDPGIQCLVILPNQAVQRVTITGTQSGFGYYDTGIIIPTGPMVFPYIVQTQDTQVNITVYFTNLGSALVLESFSNLPPFMQGVNLINGVAPSWLSGDSTLSGVANLGVNATALLLAGISGQPIKLHRATIYTDAAAACEVRLTDGTNVVGVGNVGARGLIFDHDYKGIAPKNLATGGGLTIWNPFGPAANFQYTIDYKQAPAG